MGNIEWLEHHSVVLQSGPIVVTVLTTMLPPFVSLEWKEWEETTSTARSSNWMGVRTFDLWTCSALVSKWFTLFSTSSGFASAFTRTRLDGGFDWDEDRLREDVDLFEF